MPRKIEDIKLNKNKKQITFKEEIILRGELPIKKEVFVEKEKVDSNNYQREVYKIKETVQEKEKESKIDEYLKSRLNKNNENNKRLERTPQIKNNKRPVGRMILFIFLISLISGGCYWLGNLLWKADIEITSKNKLITYNNDQFLASKNSQLNGIDFEIMIVPDKRLKSIILTESKEVSEKAKGQIVILNEYSTNAQNIVAGTMLSDEDGKTYKLDQSVSVPGYKLNDGKIIAGQAETLVTAFLPGDVYNGSPQKFYVNAFKGTAKYEKIYGKLKEPLSGGASGLVYTLDENNKESVRKIAETSFKNELYDKVKALVPDGYILYDGATNFVYKIPDNFYSKEAEAKINIDGTLSVVLLKKDSLIKNIIKTSFPKISEDEAKEIKISDLENLIFNFVNTDQQITKEIESIPFMLSGNANAIWYPNLDLLKSNLLGIHKNDTIKIFRQDPGIDSATVKIFPPWQKYIPKNIEKININFNSLTNK